ncbi:MAG: hypothetical protein BWZ10_02704 [candidate division BRC1 bacterium ADurb.BinA364]|nr:MAG: hypothetical protein BWZ10_02704 [candidate division BRC1 bacterium ADurb.BinA364]
MPIFIPLSLRVFANFLGESALKSEKPQGGAVFWLCAGFLAVAAGCAHAGSRGFTTEGRLIIGPEGKPLALKGYRLGIGESVDSQALEARFRERAANGIGGNAQAFEIWRSNNKGPSEPTPAEIADRIAYWEMWHFPGHRHPLKDEDWDRYIDDFAPRLIAKYREYEPERLFGIGFRHQNSMSRLLARGTVFDDPNLVYVIGGYGDHDTIMRNGPDKTFPTDCWGPRYTNGEFEFLTYARQKNIAIHSQEGPGLFPTNRTDPIAEKKREMVVGLFRLYNAEANGWAWHGFTPDKGFEPGTELHGIMQKAFDGSL